jgi:hypothetical protein
MFGQRALAPTCSPAQHLRIFMIRLVLEVATTGPMIRMSAQWPGPIAWQHLSRPSTRSHLLTFHDLQR